MYVRRFYQRIFKISLLKKIGLYCPSKIIKYFNVYRTSEIATSYPVVKWAWVRGWYRVVFLRSDWISRRWISKQYLLPNIPDEKINSFQLVLKVKFIEPNNTANTQWQGFFVPLVIQLVWYIYINIYILLNTCK